MRSSSAMTRLPSWMRRALTESGGLGDFFLRTFDCFEQDPAGVGSVAPLVGLEVLIVSEKMLDLLEHDRGQVLPLANVGVIRKGRVDRHADQLLVAAMLILEIKDADRPGTDNAAWDERRARDYHRVEGVAIGRQGMGHEAVIGRIAHRRVEDAI